MAEIHCHVCGGFIANPAGTSYLEPSDATPVAVPHSGLCGCTPAIVFGPPPGYVSWPGLASAARSKAASRN